MRLDKFLVHTGHGSRKEVKQIIKKKQVKVNDFVITKDDYKIDELQDNIYIDGNLVHYQKFVYIMLNKPNGVISSTDDTKHTTVIDLIEEYYHDLFPVGRLDIDTEGLLLLTNDGDLAHALLSPKKHVDKTYFVELTLPFNVDYIKDIEQGLWINEEERCMPASIKLLKEKEILLTIQEGKFHQVKRMMHACNNEVCFLKRVKMGSLSLDTNLNPGEYRLLNEEEIAVLKELQNAR